MVRSGTDLMAVACVVGGGLIAGGVTLALANGPALPSVECATTVDSDADVMVALGGEGVVMVRPDVRVNEMRECMTEEAAHNVRIQVHELDTHVQNIDREKIKREVEQARREAERVREEVDRVRDRIRRVDVRRSQEVHERAEREVQRALERVERDRERAAEHSERAVQRALERAERNRERALERAEASRERAVARVRERADRHDDEERVRMDARASRAFALAGGFSGSDAEIDEEALSELIFFDEGLTIQLDDQTFEFRFEGLDELEFEGLEDALRIQLEVLEGLDFQFDGLDEDLEDEIEDRIEEKMRELEQRLERIGSGGGR